MWFKSTPKPVPQKAPAMDMDDMMLTMRMQSKTFERQSGKSEKESKKQVEKAKLALKKRQ